MHTPAEDRERWHTEARERDEAYLALGPVDESESDDPWHPWRGPDPAEGPQIDVEQLQASMAAAGLRIIAGPGPLQNVLPEAMDELTGGQMTVPMGDRPYPPDGRLDGPVHQHFGLSYANYLVLPRTLLQSMPEAWQARFVAMLGELAEAFDHVEQAQCYKVTPGVEREVWELTDSERSYLGITAPDAPDGDGEDRPNVFYDRDGNEMEPWYRVVWPQADPVPHYNRGRTYISPRTPAQATPISLDEARRLLCAAAIDHGGGILHLNSSSVDVAEADRLEVTETPGGWDVRYHWVPKAGR
jgi:hypothetical protein